MLEMATDVEETDKRPEPTSTSKLISNEYTREILKVEELNISQARVLELVNLTCRFESETEEEHHLRAVEALEHFNNL